MNRTMASATATLEAPARGSLLQRYGSWVACCLSRGRRTPLNPGDITQLIDELGERRVAGGTYVFQQRLIGLLAGGLEAGTQQDRSER